MPHDSIGLRTCLGCGGKKSKGNLLRFAVEQGILVYDENQRLPGRGAYCCRRSECLGSFAVRKRQVAKVLRQEIGESRVVFDLLEKNL